MSLNQEQEQALEFALRGDSFFLTGPGGTGKSFVIERIQSALEKSGKSVALTALTGCAAVLLGRKAKTLHSWASIGLGCNPASSYILSIRKSPKSLRRWLMADVLIVDEVSMMTPDLLEKLDEIAKGIRRSSKTMGGLQVIFVGDFYQLPPVNKTDEETVFVFESSHWTRVVPKTIQLTQIVRQTDPIFQKILQEARMATLSEESIAILRSRKGLNWKSQTIRPTLLFSRKAEVDLVNSVNLKALKGEKKLFKASTVFLPVQATVGIDQKSSEFQNAVQKMDRDSQYVSELTLAVNAQVMLLINLDTEAGLVNGSRGVITGFTAGPNQVPLVQFKTGSPIPIEEFTWNSDQIEGLQRKQIPLCLAYAVTIHKAQGATLDSALIDIGQSTFESGQAYVALSRVRSLDSLYVWDLEVSAFKTNSKVVAHYSSLVSGSK